MALARLPLELLLHVLAYLSVPDILALRQTSHALAQLTRERAVWADALRTHVVDAGIPVHTPREQDPAALPSAALERAVVHALRVRQNWTAARPRASAVVEVRTVPPEAQRHARTYAAHFLLGTDDRYLLTMTRLDRTPREYVVQCWDLHRPDVPCVARYSTPNLRGMQVNSEGGHPVVLTITREVPNEGIVTFACGIDFSATDPDNAFEVLQQFESLGTPVKLDASTFFATDDSHRITAYSVETGSVLYVLRVPLMHNDQTVFLEEHKPLALQPIGAFLLTFTQQWTHLYFLPPPTSPPTSPPITPPTTTTPAPHIDPAASHRWPYRIDTLTAAPVRAHPLAAPIRAHPLATAPARAYPPIYLLLRFDSWYPWPVNVLHVFVLPSNPSFLSNPSFSPAQDHLPYLHAPHAAPYAITAHPSPLRLFTPADATLGRAGSALWLDAQGAQAPGLAGDRGQRVAGCVLPRVPPPPPVPSASGQGGDVGGGTVGGGGGARHAVNLEASGEARTSVFLLREDAEAWARLALGEREGRLAVACVDGRVLVYDYT